MALELSQNITPSQRLELRVTPAQLQGLEILQCPAMELQQRVNQELQQNPALLELQSAQMIPESQLRSGTQAEAADAREREWAGDLHEYAGDVLTNTVENIAPYDRKRDSAGAPLENTDFSTGELRGHEAQCRNPEAEERRQYAFDSFSCTPSLCTQLEQQLDDSAISDPALRQLCHQLCGEIDSRGYLAADDAELARSFHATEAQVKAAVNIIQQLDPPGIGARDLRECLLLQLREMHLAGSLEWEIADKHLEDVARNRIPQIAKAIDADTDETVEAIQRLKRLNPNPGWVLSFEAAPTVAPDLYIEKDPESGVWTIRMNDDNVPVLALESDYVRLAADRNTDDATRKYLNEKISSASLLISAIDNRQRTIKRVAAEIVRVQRQWFESGSNSDLRPLTLAQIADALQLSEGTVSRATASKYAQTPWGLRSFRSFFGGGYRNEQNGETVSSQSVREKIKAMIAAENPHHPLSDQAVSDQLKKDGMNVERRTVAKYRELDNIPASSIRRRH